MRTKALNTAIAVDPNDGVNLVALTRQRLKELDRLRDMAYDRLGMIARATAQLPPEFLLKTMIGPSGAGVEFDRLMRSIRQLLVLEFELRGLFKAPDRDAKRKLRLVKSDRPGFVPPKLENLFGDLDELDDFEELLDIRTDYSRKPLDEVVAGIRTVVGAEPPPNDPFASPAEKAPAAAAPPKGPEYYMRAKPIEPQPAPTQKQLGLKAATLAIESLGGKGFRKPSKAALRKHRQGRGPPK